MCNYQRGRGSFVPAEPHFGDCIYLVFGGLNEDGRRKHWHFFAPAVGSAGPHLVFGLRGCWGAGRLCRDYCLKIYASKQKKEDLPESMKRNELYGYCSSARERNWMLFLFCKLNGLFLYYFCALTIGFHSFTGTNVFFLFGCDGVYSQMLEICLKNMLEYFLEMNNISSN